MSSSFWTSSLMTLLCSGVNLRHFCLTGGWSGSTWNLCTDILGSISVMSFGLKNAGVIYQKLVNKMFANYLRYTMEVYIDVMLVKSLHIDQHLDHLRQAFEVVQKCSMKLNPTKCSFGVASGKFLGYMVTQCGIEANPYQIRSVMNIPSPTCV